MIIQEEKIENLLKLSPIQTIKMRRVTFGKHRTYIDSDTKEMYSGISNALRCATFQGDGGKDYVNTWREKMIESFGKKNTDAYIESTSDFGTLVHIAIVRLWENRFIDWSDEMDFATNYFRESQKKLFNTINDDIIHQQVFDYCQQLSSIAIFLHERVTKIYAIEAPCKCDKLMIVTPIDIVCDVRPTPKASPVTACLNLKTSNSISPSHLEQAMLELYLWNQTYQSKASHYGIIRPKSWDIRKGEPTYELKVIYGNETINQLNYLIQRLLLVKEDPNASYLKFPKGYNYFTGKTTLGEKPNIGYKKFND